MWLPVVEKEMIAAWMSGGTVMIRKGHGWIRDIFKQKN